MGFEEPTDIQQKTIPLLLSQPQDFIGLAQTGTGKTAAFGLPLIEMIDMQERHTQALILAPTRELAQQIAQQLVAFSKYMGKLNVVCVFGGASINGQISELRRGAQIVVATPGRLIDLSKRGAVRLNQVEYVVLDEADEMLNMGFKDELDTILDQTPDEKYTWLFSATMPAEIKRMVKNYMKDPQEVRINSGQTVNENIEHRFAVLKASDKVEALRRMLDFDPDMYGLVFCRTKRDTQAVAEDLVESGYAAEPLHGDLSQSQRDAVMKRFRNKTLQMLVATDVAARGIDVNNLTHVVHFALPDDAEYYTHRSGRTARAGKKGISLSLITKGEMRRVRFLENKLKISFEKALIPAPEEIAEFRINHWATKLAAQDTTGLDARAWTAALSLLEDFTKEEIIAKMVSRQMERITKNNSLTDLNDTSRISEGGRQAREPRAHNPRNERGQEAGMLRHFINVGKMDDLNKGALLRFVCDNSSLKGEDIGRIVMENKHSYIDIQEAAAGKIKDLNGMVVDGREIRVNRDDSAGRRKPIGKKKNRKKF